MDDITEEQKKLLHFIVELRSQTMISMAKSLCDALEKQIKIFEEQLNTYINESERGVPLNTTQVAFKEIFVEALSTLFNTIIANNKSVYSNNIEAITPAKDVLEYEKIRDSVISKLH